MKLPKMFVLDRDLEGKTKELLEETKPSVKPGYAKFELVRADTYAKGIAKLKEQGQKPFTFSENIEARIADYEANGENAELLGLFLILLLA